MQVTSGSEQKTLRRASGRASSWLGRLNLTLQAVLAVYIVVVFNLIVYRHPARLDLTVEKLHTLSGETLKRLALVKKDILVIIPSLLRDDIPVQLQIFNRARSLLNQYIAYQPHIRIEAELALQDQDDALRWLELRDEYGLAENQINCFIFISSVDPSLRQAVALPDLAVYEVNPPKIESFLGEAAFTQAITRLVRRDRKKVYFTRDWGEPSVRDEGVGGLSRLRQELEASSYQVEELQLVGERGIPGDCDLLVIVSPAREVSAALRARVHDYLLEGGRLLLALGPNTTGLEDVLAEWAIDVKPGQAFQKQQFLGGITQWSNLVIARKTNPSHPITRDFDKARFEVLGHHVRPLAPHYAENIQAEMLFATAQSAQGSDDVVFVDRNGNRRLDPDERGGDVVWGAAAHRKPPEHPPPGYRHLPTRIVAFGDASCLVNSSIERFSHRDLAMNAVRWLLGSEREIGLSRNPSRTRTIAWTPEIASFIFWVPVFLFPGIVLCFGLFVYFLRRS